MEAEAAIKTIKKEGIDGMIMLFFFLSGGGFFLFLFLSPYFLSFSFCPSLACH